ncbi:MAG TPA: helix-turn-helix domain-containing protein [Solirubrobacteraceae bacterium]|jgi:AcrR family transcriptional regulator|nr:helix-turn-helix domain-containing protein [Solirubrobacteraceae bacterium]
MATTTGEKPLRADAQRNQDRIIVAAHEALAELGLDVSMEEIARRAGVGPATLYRRFPSKQLLLRAILDARLDELEPLITAACAAADPWDGLVAGMHAVLDAQARHMALLQALAQAGVLPKLKAELHARVFMPLDEVFARAQAAGSVRADLAPQELPLLIRMVATTIGTGSWERYLALLADSLRAPAQAALPPA